MGVWGGVVIGRGGVVMFLGASLKSFVACVCYTPFLCACFHTQLHTHSHIITLSFVYPILVMYPRVRHVRGGAATRAPACPRCPSCRNFSFTTLPASPSCMKRMQHMRCVWGCVHGGGVCTWRVHGYRQCLVWTLEAGFSVKHPYIHTPLHTSFPLMC